MKNLPLILTIVAAVVLVIAIISRIIMQPVSIIAPEMGARALGELSMILLLMVIAINTMKK